MARGKKTGDAALELGSEEDLEQLRESTKQTYEALRNADEDDFPPERRQEYWRNRHFARTAWEHAENAAFGDLVEKQKLKLPAVAASNSKLARDVQATTNILAMLDLVSASLSVLAEVIAILGPVMAA
ncbi:MAG TPA: hypothetical protein VMU60_01615 [Syntrophobacteria bacterium]|nr:hypothetical protein [Syntrophobacteria bacterium]